jgi:DivIVA domain-containing protein
MASELPITPAEIESVRFSTGHRGDYRTEDVDPFVDGLAAEVRAGRPIDTRLAEARFRMATKRDQAYPAREVDDFIASLRGREVQATNAPEVFSPAPYTPTHHSFWSRHTDR